MFSPLFLLFLSYTCNFHFPHREDACEFLFPCVTQCFCFGRNMKREKDMYVRNKKTVKKGKRLFLVDTRERKHTGMK